MGKKVLIVSMAEFWPGISRLPKSLTEAGFEVFSLCPRTSYIARTRYISNRWVYPVFTYTRSKLFYVLLLIAILFFGPDLIIPGDEEAVFGLQQMAFLCESIPGFGFLGRLIRKSTVPKDKGRVLFSKSEFMKLCQRMGIPTPRTRVIKVISDLNGFVNEVGFPLVLKSDFGYGASGVRICSSLIEAERAFHDLTKDSFSRKLKSLLRHLFLITPEHERTVSGQQYIEGCVGMSPFSALNGKILAMNPMLKKETFPGKTGPSSVVTHFENSQICEFSKQLVSELGYTGFGSFDFILDQNGKIFIIEMNPRPVPVSHFTAEQAGVSLSIEFYKATQENHQIDAQTAVSHQDYTIALFPNEERRDPKSAYLGHGTYDIPTDDPGLVEALRKE